MLFKKLIRTMGQYKAQFISMIIMIAIGIGIFVGFNMEWTSIQKNTGKFFDETKLADYHVVTENVAGFTKEECDKIKNIDGVSAATRYATANVEVYEVNENYNSDIGSDKFVRNGDELALCVSEEFNVSTFVLLDGKEYDSSYIGGVWISDTYAKKNGFALGDEIMLVFKGILRFQGTVVGYIKSGENMICVRDESQLMPDYNTFGYAYISPAFYKSVMSTPIYSYINVRSSVDVKNFKVAVKNAFDNKTTLVIPKEQSTSYAGAQSESQEGQTMGAILPVVFLLIAVLTMVTTMHRLTVKEKTQIGILKALGFKDKKILRHYTSYAFLIGIIGIGLGIGLGYFVAWFIMNPNGSMGTYFDMPEWRLYIPWFCWVILALILAALTLIGYLSVKKMLRGTAAETLQPYTPKKMKNLAIEKTKLWNKFSFGTKWNMRDVMRHKSRTIMSLIGIIGCTVIILGSLGMRDTMNAYLATYYDGAMKYSSRIYVNDEYAGDRDELVAKFQDADWSGSIAVEITEKGGEEKAVSLDVYGITNGKIAFPDGKNGYTEIADDGAYVCQRIAKAMGLKKGSSFTVSPYGTERTYELTVAAVIRSVSESIVITPVYAKQVGFERGVDKDYEIDSIYVSENRDDIIARRDAVKSVTIGDEAVSEPVDPVLKNAIKNVLSKQDIMKSFDSFLELMNQMIAVLIVAGIILGVVVLYNLGVMSYTERYREMATLKVIGFKDRKIGGLLIGQNMWVTLLGVIIGIPCGIGLLAFLMTELASEYELTLNVGVLSYLVSIVITFGVSLLVSFMVSRKNKKIDMVEALKGAE